MDLVPRPQKNTKKANKGVDGQPEQDGLFIYPRIEYIKKTYVTGDSVFGTFMVAWIAGAIHFYINCDEFTAFEKFMVTYMDAAKVSTFMRNNIWISFVVGIAYVAMLIFGPMFMENRKRPTWMKNIIIGWNFILVVFSTMGAYRMIHLIFTDILFFHAKGLTAVENFHHIVCPMSYDRCSIYQTGCLWLCLFCLSKIPEMLDTFFLIATKKKPIFLHWFHHLTVMFFCWLSYAYMTPAGIIYCVMNFCVHSLMYAWYGLAAYGLKPKRWLSQVVTVLQIVQMVLGAFVAFYTQFTPTCLGNHYYVTRSSLFIYGSYLVLFVQFFIKAYCRTGPKKKRGCAPKVKVPEYAKRKGSESPKSKRKGSKSS